MQKSIRIFFYFAALTIITACEKTTDIPSVEVILTSRKWQMVSWTSSPAFPVRSGTTTVNVSDWFQYYKSVNDVCSIDQSYTFSLGPQSSQYKNGTFDFYKGKKACSNIMPETSGVWNLIELSGNGPTLATFRNADDVSKNSFLSLYRILEITPDKLTISDRYAISGSPLVYIWTRTFKQE